jgi:hypothetical protein
VIQSSGKIQHTIDLRAMPTSPSVAFTPLSTADVQILADEIMASDEFKSVDAPTPRVEIPSMDGGIFAHVGDQVDIYLSAEKQCYNCRIVAYDLEGDFKHQKKGVPVAGYQVLYNDQSRILHRVDDASEQVRVTIPIDVVVAAASSASVLAYDAATDFNTGLCSTSGVKSGFDTVLITRAFKPHASVEKYINEHVLSCSLVTLICHQWHHFRPALAALLHLYRRIHASS